MAISLTIVQHQILGRAGDIALEQAVPKNLVKAMCLVESSAGLNITPGKEKSYGVMQVTLPAARAVVSRVLALAKYKDKTDNELAGLLQEEPYINIRFGVAYLKYCKEMVGTWEAALVCYNAGRGTVARLTPEEIHHNLYVKRVRKYQEELR